MPTYDDGQLEVYHQASSAFGATTESSRWFGPRGKQGYVVDIDIYITADMVGTTTVPEICVGSSQGNAAYARFRLGTAVGTGYTSAQGARRATQVAGDVRFPVTYSDFAGHVSLATSKLPANTEFYISRVAGTGGTPAGTGVSRVLILWF